MADKDELIPESSSTDEKDKGQSEAPPSTSNKEKPGKPEKNEQQSGKLASAIPNLYSKFVQRFV